MKNLVTSLPLSKQLEKLGVEQDSLFYHAIEHIESGQQPEPYSDIPMKCIVYRKTGHGENIEIICSAFLSGELGEKLPVAIETKKTSNSSWFCGDKSIQDSRNFRVYRAGKTEAEARGKMLAYLIEKGLLDRKSIQ